MHEHLCLDEIADIITSLHTSGWPAILLRRNIDPACKVMSEAAHLLLGLTGTHALHISACEPCLQRRGSQQTRRP
jgi:hypothetical protein